MSLADRTRTVLWGNINAILSRLEQSSNDLPGLLERMGQEIQKAKRELLRVMGEEKLLRERAETRLIESQQWQTRAELAVRTGDDSLARSALVQFRRLKGESDHDATAAEELGSLAQAIKSDVLQMEQKHGAYSARQATPTTAIRQSRTGGGVESLGALPGRSPFDDLRRVEHAIEHFELANEAENEIKELLCPRPGLAQELSSLDESTPLGLPKFESRVVSPEGDAPKGPAKKRRVRVE
jgi:phage shock protein A